MADAFIVGIAGKIVANLVSQALENVGKLWGVKHELEVLRDTVSTIQAVLEHAEEQYYQSHQIQVWLEKLKDAFYDAQDVLEEFKIEALRRDLRGHNEISKGVRTFFSSSNQLAFKLRMSYKVRTVREKIEAIKDDRKFHLDERPVDLPVKRKLRKREETHSFIREGDITGRDDDKKNVMKFLLDSDMKEHVSILPIVGIGGLGKTALAQCVYNDEMVSKQFNLKMWVCVSNDFDMKRVVKNIITCAKKKKPTEDAMERLQSELRAAIDGKRYLLVLDDLWNAERETWLSLKNLLMGGARGSKILVTTRLPLVAEITHTVPPHVLKGLSESASIDLLMKMAFRKEEEIQDPDMLTIGKEMVRKCSGVPLVVRAVGSLLFFKKTKPEWLHFKDHELPDVSQSEDNIKSVLRLSYDRLPSHLKQCFTLCSLFPKDYEIKKQTLVNLWVAEGFIQPSNKTPHLEDIAHGYFMELLRSNFFQDFQKHPFTREETCKMHDLMHDLACLVARTEYGVAQDDTKTIYESTRHLSYGSIFNLMGGLPISCLKARAVRTILSTCWGVGQQEPTSEADLRQLIQNFKSLRILDLHATNVKKMPRSICKLKYLTYLDLSYNDALKRLPNSITRLQNLQTLNLSGCISLEELPRGVKKLVSLRNLDLDFCHKLSFVPCGLGQLSSLHRLTRFILPEKKSLTKNYCRLRELNEINNIRGSLCIENLGSVTDAAAESKAANLIAKHSLESLAFKWGNFDTNDAIIVDRDEALLDGLRPHPNLQELTINGYKGESLPNWMMDNLVSSLPNLVMVCFYKCGRCKHLPPLGQLPHLKTLEIRELTELEYIESDHSSTLIASFPSLLKLVVFYCGNLKAMPRTPHLEELMLIKANQALINHLFGLNKLKSLDISDMEYLPKEGLKSLTSLEYLSIWECPWLTSLSLGMRHLSSLVDLSIRFCVELDLSKDESGNILDFQGLQSLHSINITLLPKLASLPLWLWQVSNLECLRICDCSNLKAIPEQIEALQSLQRFEIIDCPSLMSFPEGMRRLTSLTHLRIVGCPELENRCKKDAGNDWYKISHVLHLTIEP
ncbi:putative disease resistance protein RGA4 [Eucalyptus grandis]|uniref:putative disease resistance protein RGA4 n=1 Tax=Eucalyptus grandis TaxID=71139 RepID=UPI00192E85B5|nr:putative disease resistance protein RGA4 [Eucalyptus grandis]